MRVVYANAEYKHNSAEGGPAHMRQFIENATSLGHEIFLWHGIDANPLTKPVPEGALRQLKFFRGIDLIYYRIEAVPPKGARVVLPPYRKLAGNPLIAWEFNTVPEYGRLYGITEAGVQACINELKRLAPGVDLAVCVSNKIADYVKTNLGIRRTLVIPNGSDPELFKPGVPTVRRLEKRAGRLDVVWIGSANVAWHNFGLLRDAAWSIWNKGEGETIALHVIGPGMKEMRDLPPNVNYYGPEEYSRLPNWLSGMDVGLNVYRPGPADYSSPLKVFDYMACGLAVVGTEHPQTREIMEQLGQTDLLIPVDAPERLADALRGLAADRDRVRRQGEAGRKLVIEKYNWRRAVTDTFAELEKLRSE